MLANTFNQFFSTVKSIGVQPDDSHEMRLEKNLLVASALMMSTLGILWGFLYLYLTQVAT